MQLTKCAVNNNSDSDSDFDGLVGAARMQIYWSGRSTNLKNDQVPERQVPGNRPEYRVDVQKSDENKGIFKRYRIP